MQRFCSLKLSPSSLMNSSWYSSALFQLTINNISAYVSCLQINFVHINYALFSYSIEFYDFKLVKKVRGCFLPRRIVA